jgi:hypothetical protein
MRVTQQRPSRHASRAKYRLEPASTTRSLSPARFSALEKPPETHVVGTAGLVGLRAVCTCCLHCNKASASPVARDVAALQRGDDQRLPTSRSDANQLGVAAATLYLAYRTCILLPLLACSQGRVGFQNGPRFGRIWRPRWPVLTTWKRPIPRVQLSVSLEAGSLPRPTSFSP